MSLVAFEKMHIENYSSLGKVDLPLNNLGLCLIEGKVGGDPDKSNGAGKTSLVEAFYYGITGEFFDPNTTQILAMNRFSKGDLVVDISGKKGETPFRIVRKLVRQKSKAQHVLDFEVNGEEVHTSGIDETQERINEFLGTNQMLFLNSKIFGQGEISSFTKVDDRKKKVILDNILGIGTFDKFYHKAKEYVSKANTKLTALKIERDSIARAIESTESKLFQSKQAHLLWEKEREKEIELIQREIKGLEEKAQAIDVAVETITKTSGTQEDATRLLAEIQKMEDEVKTTGSLLQNQVMVKREEASKLLGAIDGVKDRISEAAKECNELNKLLAGGGTCSKCKQPISSDHIATIMSENMSKIEEYQKKMDELKQSRNVAVEEAKGIETKISTDVGSVLTDLRQNREKIQKSSHEFQRAESLRGDKKRVEAQIEFSKKRISQLQTSSSPHISFISTLEIEIITETDRLNTFKVDVEKWEKDHLYYNLISKAFDRDGIPQLVSERAITILNRLLKNYSQRILGNGFGIQFSMKERGGKPQIMVDVDHPEGGPTYYRCSQGEKKKIDVCQMLALSDLANSQNKCNFNVKWFDEVFAELDQSVSGTLLEVLRSDPTSSKFVITHKDLFKEEFKNRVIVEKKTNTSEVYLSSQNRGPHEQQHEQSIQDL